MLNKASKVALLASALAFSGFSQANNFNYNYGEVRIGASPSSFGGEFSALLTQNAHMVLRANTQMDNDADLAAGVGFNGPMSQFFDITGQILVHYVNYPNDASESSSVETELNLGGRVWLTNQIEGSIKGGFINDHSIFAAGARFHSTEQLSLSLEAYNNGLYGPQVSMTVRFQL
ncbi:hypothetical protein [Vibrio maerlii]|uniref:hypothetical protein n=1 Tax=Vibrio maerlii TaxID=2231648 RepID=UPI000E3B5767|nr:hypothetical protein [Vibrio maerlii]